VNVIAFKEVWDGDLATTHSTIRFDNKKNQKRIGLAFAILRE
jgi:hypothetical protein